MRFLTWFCNRISTFFPDYVDTRGATKWKSLFPRCNDRRITTAHWSSCSKSKLFFSKILLNFHSCQYSSYLELFFFKFSQWNWTSYVNAIFNNTNVTIKTNVDRVIVMDLLYLQKLPKLLAETPPGTIGIFYRLKITLNK